jgi:hypothetical protein
MIEGYSPVAERRDSKAGTRRRSIEAKCRELSIHLLVSPDSGRSSRGPRACSS